MKPTQTYSLLLILVLALASCTGAKYNLLHNVGGDQASAVSQSIAPPTVKVGQELCIAVSALNEESVAYFRTSRWKEGATGQECLYYRVDDSGAVNIPILGAMEVAGLSLAEIEVKLAQELGHLLKEPKVRAQYVDYNVSVMGEVAIPGTYTFEDGRVTLLEAIARAGGIGQFGKRDNVLIVRDTPEGIKHIRVDLTSEDLWSSEYYYLHHNDVVMVDSNPARVANAHNISTYGSVLVGLGTIVAILSTR